MPTTKVSLGFSEDMMAKALDLFTAGLTRAIPAVLILTIVPFAQAQVLTCNALTMYGWGVSSGTCSSLSPATQNLWVCEISHGNPEIHTTFNAATPLHLTVRSGTGCEGNTGINGAFPANLALANNANICGVTVTNYRDRLNAIMQGPTPGGATACRAGFLTASAASRLGPTAQAAYLNLCNAQHCP